MIKVTALVFAAFIGGLSLASQPKPDPNIAALKAQVQQQQAQINKLEAQAADDRLITQQTASDVQDVLQKTGLQPSAKVVSVSLAGQ